MTEENIPSKLSPSLLDFLKQFGVWVEGAFIWSPPRGGVLNSQAVTSARSSANTSQRELKSLGIGDEELRHASTPAPRTLRARSGRKDEKTEKTEKSVSGLYTPEGSKTPSSLQKEHFETKKKVQPLQRAASLSSISTPGSLSPSLLDRLSLTPGGSDAELARTPETLAEAQTPIKQEEEDSDSEKEVERSVIDPDSPRQDLLSPTPSEADRTFTRVPDEQDVPIEQNETEREAPKESMAAAPIWGQLRALGGPGGLSYDGDQSKLHAYLREFEVTIDEEGSEEPTVAACVKYVRDTRVRRVFELTEKQWRKDAETNKTRKKWADFKKRILERYPGAYDDSRAYTIESLEHHISSAPASAFQNAAEFQEFMNTFEVIAEELLDKGLMTEPGINGKLCNAIPQSEVKRITLQQDYLGQEASSVKWREFGERYRKMLATGETGLSTRDAGPKITAKAEPAVKAEPAETAAMMAAISALNSQMQALVESQQQRAQYPPPRDWNRSPFPPRTNSWGNQPSGGGFSGECGYCGVPGHLIAQCELYGHDRAANGVYYQFRTNSLKVYGTFVPVAAGASPAAAVAEFRGNRFIPMGPPPTVQAQAPNPPTSTNMMSVVSAGSARETVSVGISRVEPRIEEWHSDEEEAEVEDDEGDEHDMTETQIIETMAQIQRALAKKKMQVVLPTLESVKKSKKSSGAKGKAVEEVADEAANELGAGPKKAERKAAQFHLEAATDNPEAQARVLEACKDGCVPMTFGDLLAVSDPLRAKVHAETRRKRVPNAGADEEKEELRMSSVREAAVNELWGMVLAMPVSPALSKLMAASDFVRNNMHADTNRRAQLAAEQTTPTMAFLPAPSGIRAGSPRVAIAAKETHLWGVNAFIADFYERQEFQLTDVVIDDGSGICAIRADVAERLNFPYEHAPIICQQFDGTQVEHGDLIRNLPVTIGSVRVYVQAYVLPNIGPEMILGGPFEEVVRLGKETMEGARPVYRFRKPGDGQEEVEVVGHVRPLKKKGF